MKSSGVGGRVARGHGSGAGGGTGTVRGVSGTTDGPVFGLGSRIMVSVRHFHIMPVACCTSVAAMSIVNYQSPMRSSSTSPSKTIVPGARIAETTGMPS